MPEAARHNLPGEDESDGATVGSPEAANGDSSAPPSATTSETQTGTLGQAENEAVSSPIEDLTLDQMLGSWLRAPRRTWRRLQVALAVPAAARLPARAPQTMAIPSAETGAGRRSLGALLRSQSRVLRQTDVLQPVGYALAFVSALIGSVIVRGAGDVTRGDLTSLEAGAPCLWLGFVLWLVADVVGERAQLAAYWKRLDRSQRLAWVARALPTLIWIYALLTLAEAMNARREDVSNLALTAVGLTALGGLCWIAIEAAKWWHRRGQAAESPDSPPVVEETRARQLTIANSSRARKLLIALAFLASLIVWVNTSGNRIEPPIIVLWLLSVALWALVFAPLRWNVFAWASDQIDAFHRRRWREHRGTIIAMALVMLLGGAFRFNELEAYPPQMYSDLVEKIQDAYKIHHQGDYRIFFQNIGGREPLHFYLLSVLASQPGMEFNHYALKLLSALESFITLPILFWLGVEVMGKERRRFGMLFGALAAALVAVSFWHVVIGRQGMRISLAPLFSALTAAYLIRALRHNRRPDWVKAGLALGFGLLGYQAVRMLPVVAVAGAASMALVCRDGWRARLRYLLNLATLAFVSLMVFLPLLHYWVEEPESYMRRASTRVFGDAPTSDAERAAFISESIPALLRNIRKTALMYHFYGDSSWVSGLGDEPAMDPVTSALMLLGSAAWLSLIVRTRDPIALFVLIYLLAMLLPTALALSFPIEVPSFIRASGAIPPSYLLAALPLAVFCRHLCNKVSGRKGAVLAFGMVACLLLAANHYNASMYFGRFTDNYRQASHPQAQAGRLLRGFAESDGAFGNAFALTSPHWWDIRAVGIEAGRMFWDSGGDVSALPQLLAKGLRREAAFRLDPERDMLFFYARENADALPALTRWFPGGRQLEIRVEPAHKSFYVYRAPALGTDGLRQFLDDNLHS